MPKERKAATWESNDEEVSRLFLLTPDDLYASRVLYVLTRSGSIEHWCCCGRVSSAC
jgi:hypothetical protein